MIHGTAADDTNTVTLAGRKKDLLVTINGVPQPKRLALLRIGAPGIPALNATTVLKESDADNLVGGAGTDWFFAGQRTRRPTRPRRNKWADLADHAGF